jgi:metal-responsive CopG/Arc/MetJ family transcriptional regulator
MEVSMSVQTEKVAVSLPKEAFRKMEHTRHELGLARSEALTQALRLWLRERDEEERQKQYVEGYLKKPEKASEVEPFFRAGLASLSKESWD